MLHPSHVTTEELKTMARLIPVPFLVICDSGVLFANERFHQLTGYQAKDLDAAALLQVIHPDHRERFWNSLTQILKTKDQINDLEEFRILTRDGRSLWLDYDYYLIEFSDTTCVLAALRDITDKKQHQMALARLVKLRGSMLEITQAIIGAGQLDYVHAMVLEKATQAIPAAKAGSVLLRDGMVLKLAASYGFQDKAMTYFSIHVTESFLYQATDGEMDRIINISDLRKLHDLKYPLPLCEETGEPIRSALTAPLYVNDAFWGILSVDSDTPDAFDEDDIKVMQFIQNHMEIAVNRHLSAEERNYLLQYDSLTHLYNRTFFEELFQQIMEKAARYRESFQLVLIDLNCLKEVNDHFGHYAGDLLLKHFADHLKNAARKSDLLSRYGGDEFVGVFFQASMEQIQEKMLGLLSELESKPLEIEDVRVECSFSYGIASFQQDGETLQDLVRVADARMYRFKNAYKTVRSPIYSGTELARKKSKKNN